MPARLPCPNTLASLSVLLPIHGKLAHAALSARRKFSDTFCPPSPRRRASRTSLPSQFQRRLLDVLARLILATLRK